MTQSPGSGSPDPFQPPLEPPPRTRASDADREWVVRTLHDAVARGLLTLEEGDERVAAAYTARFMDDLSRLTADLPPAPPPAPVAPGWRALALLAWLQLRTALAGISWRSVRARPRLVVAVAVAVVLAVAALGAITGRGEASQHGRRGVEQFEHVGPR
jgi:phytoene dehydrogenase-like protein